MPDARIAAPAEHRGVGGVDRIRFRVVLHHQPRRCRVADLADECLPRQQQAPAESLRSPLGSAFLDLRGGKKQSGARARQVFGAAELLDMGAADRATVFQIAEAGMNLPAQGGIAGEID